MTLQIPSNSILANIEDKGERRNFNFKILKDGVDIGKFASLVKHIEVKMSDDSIDFITIHFSDPGEVFSSDIFFKPNSLWDIWMGYETTTMKYMGQFILSNPKYNYGELGGIEITGYSPIIRMARDQKRRSFLGRTDSEIVNQLALENNFIPDVEPTPIRYNQFTQANETDYDILMKLAERNGFIFYWEKGVLHFHQIRPIHVGFTIPYQRNEGVVRECNVTVLSEGKFGKFNITGVNPITGRVQVLSGSFAPDNLTDILVGVDGVDIFANRRNRFLTGVGQERTLQEYFRIASAATQASRYSVVMSCETMGIEDILCRRLIGIRGISRYSGIYYIKNVRHVWNADTGYNTFFEGYRTYSGNFRQFVSSQFDTINLEERKVASIGQSKSIVQIQ